MGLINWIELSSKIGQKAIISDELFLGDYIAQGYSTVFAWAIFYQNLQKITLSRLILTGNQISEKNLEVFLVQPSFYQYS